jgi:hypothetical protein
VKLAVREIVDDKAFLKQTTTARCWFALRAAPDWVKIRWPLAVAG